MERQGVGKHCRDNPAGAEHRMSNVLQTKLNEGGIDMDRLRIQDNDEDGTSTGVPDTQSLLQQQETPDVAYFGCGWCGFSHPKERTVRAHITREDDDHHKNKNAFIDDIFLQAYDADGEVIGDMESPKTQHLSDTVTDEHLPESAQTGTQTAEILKVAIANPHMEPADIAKEVYDDPMSGNKSYVYRVLDRHLSSDAAGMAEPEAESTSGDQPLTAESRRGRTAEPDETPTKQLPSDEKSYEDLEPKQKIVINEVIRDEVNGDDRAMTEIEDLAEISTGYGSRILGRYEHVYNNRLEQYEAGEIEELPEPSDILGDEDTESKSYDELTPRQQRLLDHWVADPDETKSAIEQKSLASPGYSARIYRRYGDIRDERREAFEEGVLTETHLNTPDPETIVENPDADPGDWEAIPEDRQPTGVSIDAAKAGETGTEVEPATSTATSADTDAQSDAVEDVREDVEALESSVSEQLSQIIDRIAELETATAELQSESTADVEVDIGDGLQEQMTTLESRVEMLESQGGVTEPAATESDEGQTQVVLDRDQWTTVIKALSNHLPEDDNDVLHDVVVQA